MLVNVLIHYLDLLNIVISGQLTLTEMGTLATKKLVLNPIFLFL
jgi:hypothetical protein